MLLTSWRYRWGRFDIKCKFDPENRPGRQSDISTKSPRRPLELIVRSPIMDNELGYFLLIFLLVSSRAEPTPSRDESSAFTLH